MKVLGLDTATSGCSAALWVDGRIAVRRSTPMARGQAEALVPMAVAVLADAGVAFAELDRIAVTVGPGAFTGLRIALAAARGFALGIDVPVAGVTSFAAIAHGVPGAERAGRSLLVAVDSRRAEPYLQRFGPDLEPVGEPAMLPADAVAGWLADWTDAPLLVAGDGAGTLRDALAGRPGTAVAEGSGIPDAAVVAALGAMAGDTGAPPRPLYIRPPDVTLPRGAA